MRRYRKNLVAILFEITQGIYTKYFKKNTPWNLTKLDLLKYAKSSFGYKLGVFLDQNGFDLIPKAERHDAYHVITGYTSKEEDEIALQYLCFGNGKRSLYLFGVVCLGTIILPEYYRYYLKSYHLGKNLNKFYDLDFKGLLKTDFQNLKTSIFNKKQLKNKTLKTTI